MDTMIDMEVMEKIPRYFFFFKNQLGITEVQLPNQPVRLFYFEKPFCSNFLSPFIKKHLIYGSNRESDEDRLLFLLDNFEFYYKQLMYRQFLYRFWISKFI